MALSTADFLEEQYKDAISKVGSQETITTDLNEVEQAHLNIILQYSESAKGVLTVFVTSVVYKILHPEQDVRKHQDSIFGGYSGRTFDNKNITPFLKRHQFPAIRNGHGCQVIANGIMPSLKYYLRLLDNSFEFIDKYVNLLENDTALKFEHKVKWNHLTSELS